MEQKTKILGHGMQIFQKRQSFEFPRDDMLLECFVMLGRCGWKPTA